MPVMPQPARVTFTYLGVDDPDGDAAEARQPGAVGQAAHDGKPGALFPVRTRIRKPALVPAICAARNPAPKFRPASRIMPAQRRVAGRAVDAAALLGVAITLVPSGRDDAGIGCRG
jgi:hypothetical protein